MTGRKDRRNGPVRDEDKPAASWFRYEVQVDWDVGGGPKWSSNISPTAFRHLEQGQNLFKVHPEFGGKLTFKDPDLALKCADLIAKECRFQAGWEGPEDWREEYRQQRFRTRVLKVQGVETREVIPC